MKTWLNHLSNPQFPIAGLHNLVQRVPRWRRKCQTRSGGVCAFVAFGFGQRHSACRPSSRAFAMRISFSRALKTYVATFYTVRFSLLTIAAMLALGYTTRYSGLDATMGLAFARSGAFYPFFGTLLGWLGVALTGSDTSSNILFGSLQRITAQQLGLSPLLMAAANSSGGVMGKMIDAQSIVVASTATNWFGHEGEILRYCVLSQLGARMSQSEFWLRCRRMFRPSATWSPKPLSGAAANHYL